MIPGTMKTECNGCMACCHVCPKSCILMKPDEKGFLYPEIEKGECIECGMCSKICPVQNLSDVKKDGEPDVFAVKHKDDHIRFLSSSGGAFTAVSDFVLESGGLVYGVVLDEKMEVKHQKAQTKLERDMFRKSKYAQSNLGNVFKEVDQNLKSGRKVLFSGTPCQIAGIKAYLGKNDDRLITCDVICHGVLSMLLFNDYLLFIEKKFRSVIKSFEFRTKEHGWRNYSPIVTLLNGRRITKNRIVDSYFNIYFTNLALRPSCYICPYASIDRNSDLTLGDFWGIETHYPKFSDEKGVSLLILNTDNGRHVFDQIKQQLNIEKTTISECMQTNLNSPTQPRGDRKLFWEQYAENGYTFLAKHYGGCNMTNAAKGVLKKILSTTGMISQRS